MSLQFGWSDFWVYYHSVEDEEIKAHLEEEVIGKGWLYTRPVQEQKKVLAGAPEDFVRRIAGNLKPEIQIDLGLNPYA